MVHDKPGHVRSVSFYHSGVRSGEAPSVAALPPIMALSQLKPLAPGATSVEEKSSTTSSGRPELLASGVPRKRGNLRLDEVAAEEAAASTPSSSSTPAALLSPVTPGPFAEKPPFVPKSD
jgi:hypothetical protein